MCIRDSVYYVSVAGVTGAGAATLDHVEEAVARLRRHTDLPLCIGFGIRTPEHAAEVARRAEGAVVGSAPVSYTHLDVYKRQPLCYSRPVYLRRSRGKTNTTRRSIA